MVPEVKCVAVLEGDMMEGGAKEASGVLVLLD